jgi:hypothetical protein
MSVGNYCAFKASETIEIARAAGTWTPLNIIVAFARGALLFGELDHFPGIRFVLLAAALAAILAGILLIVSSKDSSGARVVPADPPSPQAIETEPVPLENSQRVLVAFGGHETCPRPVLGGLAWRVRWPRRGWRARVCCPAAVPRRGVLSLRVYRAVVLVSGPGSPRTGVHGGDLWGIVLACCPCRRKYPWSPRARKIV